MTCLLILMRCLFILMTCMFDMYIAHLYYVCSYQIDVVIFLFMKCTISMIMPTNIINDLSIC